MKQCIEEILNENPVLTRDGINRLLQERLPDKPRKVLNGMLYTFKLVRRCPAERNRPDVIQSRREYAAWFLGEAIQRQIVFIDECGFNVWTARSQGRALRGDGAYRQVSSGVARVICLGGAKSYSFFGSTKDTRTPRGVRGHAPLGKMLISRIPVTLFPAL